MNRAETKRRQDDIAVGEQYGALQDIAQLADVGGKGIAAQQAQSLRIRAHRPLRRQPCEQRIDQRPRIVAAFAQWRAARWEMR